MKTWVSVLDHPPPVNRTILARYGADWCFVAYSRIFDRWRHIFGGKEWEIGQPDEWFADVDAPAPGPGPVAVCRPKPPKAVKDQFILNLG